MGAFNKGAITSGLFTMSTMVVEAETSPTREVLRRRSLPGTVMLQRLWNGT